MPLNNFIAFLKKEKRKKEIDTDALDIKDNTEEDFFSIHFYSSSKKKIQLGSVWW